MEGFMTLKEASMNWGLSERRVNTLCLEGRISGASKFGKSWAIPVDTKKLRTRELSRVSMRKVVP